MKTDYENIKVDYIGKKEAIAIANNDKTLKQAMYSEARKEGMIYGLLVFHEFKVKLVKWGSYFAWHLKLVDGEWGATMYEKKFGIRYKTLLCDGEFTEDSNINCLVLIDNGEFIYLKEEDLKLITEADVKEYEEYIKMPSFWIKGKEMPKSKSTKKAKKKPYVDLDENGEIEW